jgi:hypothetical protein
MMERFTEHKADRPDLLVRHFIHGKPRGFAYESIRHFVDQLITGESFLVSVEDAYNTNMIILAIFLFLTITGCTKCSMKRGRKESRDR